MKKQSKYYFRYRFNDKTSYKVEINKDGVTESEMRKLRRTNKNQNKRDNKVNKLDTVSLEAIISGEDKHSTLIDECADVELLIETADEYDSLHKAIANLLPEQQELIQRIYFQDVSARQYAREKCVSHTLINKQLKSIYETLKKYL